MDKAQNETNEGIINDLDIDINEHSKFDGGGAFAIANAYAYADAYAAYEELDHDHCNITRRSMSRRSNPRRHTSTLGKPDATRCVRDLNDEVESALTLTTGSLDTCSIFTEDNDGSIESLEIPQPQSSSYSMIVPRLLSLSLDGLSFGETIRQDSTEQTRPHTPLYTTESGCCRELPLVDQERLFQSTDDEDDDLNQESLLSSPQPLLRLLTCYEEDGGAQTETDEDIDPLYFEFDVTSFDEDRKSDRKDEGFPLKKSIFVPTSPSAFLQSSKHFGSYDSSNSNSSNEVSVSRGPQNVFRPKL